MRQNYATVFLSEQTRQYNPLGRLKMRQTVIFLALVTIVFVLCGTAESACKISSAQLGSWQTTVVENELVRVVFVPVLGGRIVEYSLKSSGNNEVAADVEKIAALPPGGQIPAEILNYLGGYEDTITEKGLWSWPGDFRAEPYSLEVIENTPERITVKLTAAKGSIRIERTHTLCSGSTTLSNQLKVTNTTDAPIEMMLRHKFVAHIGGGAKPGDVLAYPAKSGIVCKKYFPDNVWMDFAMTSPWISGSNPRARETFLLTSRAEQLGNGGIWFDRNNFYNIEMFAIKQNVAAGKSTTFDTQWHIFEDVPLITFATDKFIGFFEGKKGDDHQFTLNTGIIAVSDVKSVSIDGIFYNGPNIIDSFKQQMELRPFRFAKASTSKKLFSPVDEIRAEFVTDANGKIRLQVPLASTEPPKPVVLTPLAQKRYRYTLADNADYQLWVESTSGIVSPTEVFNDKAPAKNIIEIEVLPNEYECVQLVIHPKQADIKDIRPKFADLKEVKSGATLPAGAFTFYRGETIPLETGLAFDPLIPDAAVTAGKDKNAIMLIELKPDYMQLPGTYEGIVELVAAEKVLTSVNLRVKVRPFQMPFSRSLDTAFWVWKTWATPGHNDTSTWPVLARYRLSPGWLRASPFAMFQDTQILDCNGKAKPGKTTVWSNDAKKWYMEALHENNQNQICPAWNIWGYVDTWEWKHDLVRNTRAQTGWFDKNGLLSHCYYQIVDEPLASRFAELREVIKLYRQADPDYKIMCTVAINPDLYGYIDIWFVPWGALEPEIAKQRQELGEKVWLYNANPNIMGIGRMPRLVGWFCWKYQVDGYLHYAVDYTDSETGDNPWNVTSSHWATLFYPKQKTWDPNLKYFENAAKWDWAYPSIRLMQIRDGFEDYEYMNILRNWINLARRRAPNEQDTSLIAEAEELLSIANKFVGNFYTTTENCEDMAVARKQVGDMIEKLRLKLTAEQY